MPETNMTRLLERSLERNRLAHACLFSGDSLEELEGVARTLAKALNCPSARTAAKRSLHSCGQCDSCRRIEHDNHPDVLWVRPESKSRVITIEQIRELMHTVHLKPTVAEFKVGVVVAADRLNPQAGNAFLKTLEEPPDKSILLLLTTEPQRILETILSRCLRLSFGGDGAQARARHAAWLAGFSELAARPGRGLMGRYQLLGLIMKKLAEQKSAIEESLAARSPLEQYDDLDPRMREKLEDELAAAVESEYRRERADVLGALHGWLRDVWLQSLQAGAGMLCFPDLQQAAAVVAGRISSADAMRNLEHLDRLQRQLNSNVQEALALEVGLLKLKL
jgi:DNA polymerase-3 subunit delta'